jgi:hypothetical protein
MLMTRLANAINANMVRIVTATPALHRLDRHPLLPMNGMWEDLMRLR